MAQGQLKTNLMQLSTHLVWERISLDMRWSSLRTRLTRLRCSESGELGRATTSHLYTNYCTHLLYSQSIMVIHANTNYCTHLSCSSWEDTTFQGACHQRQVNAVLGNLVRMHYPGKVTRSDGTTSTATCRDDYTLSPDATYVTANGTVWSDFWVSFSAIFFQSFIPDAPDFATA
jgi:hypothetical protein